MKFICFAIFASVFVFAQAGAQAPLPSTVTDVLAKAGVPLDNVAVVVREAGAADTRLSFNADKPMNPASVMKLVTTYAGLELLGPAYTWKTELYVSGELRGSRLQGDLVFKGGGDPKLTVERLRMLARQLRDRGLFSIHGDLVLDKTFFDTFSFDPAKFDGEPLKAYNVGPDALLMNFKTVRFFFAPALDDRAVTISPDVRPSQLEIVNRMRLTEGPCGDWREHIALDVQTPTPTQVKVTFSGRYPRSCGESAWSLSLLDHARFDGGVFASIWKEAGGVWTGAVRLGPTPPDARLVATLDSAPLAEAVRDINKYSNNVMARQLFLTLSAEAINGYGAIPPAMTTPAAAVTSASPISPAPPEFASTPNDNAAESAAPQSPAAAPSPAPAARGSAERSAQLVRDWLRRKGIAANELVMENGSGLSRKERISAQTLASMLDAAWRSSVMPELVSSLSLFGVDGTFRKRSRGEPIVGQAHVKSGTLNDVRAMAGYVQDANGKRWIVVMFINHPAALQAQAAQDALLQWVYGGEKKPAVLSPAG